MTVGTVTLHLNLPGCRSLKEKRSVIRHLSSILRKDFNVSVAEIGHNDLHQTATLGVALVANDRSYANAVLSKVVNRVERDADCYLQRYDLEFR